MIIPVRCFGCGKVIADKWLSYSEQMEKLKSNHTPSKNSEQKNIDPVHSKEVLESLGIERMCCKIHFLGHVDLIDKI